MLKIGTHLTSAKGFAHMGEDSLKAGASTLQFFTRNPRGTKAKALNIPDAEVLLTIMRENDFAPIIAHAPYTLNACSADPHVRELAAEMFADDLARLECLPGNYYNFHPGSHVNQGVETGTAYIAGMLNQILRPEQKTIVLLETMSGKGTEIGKTFEELKDIIDRVSLKDKLGICFDSCHLSDSGYDIINNLDGVLSNFDKIIGLSRLCAFHINDSMNPPGSHKDRHARIGEGYLGLNTIVSIINHPALRALPFILETPTDLEGHAAEIRLLKSCFADLI